MEIKKVFYAIKIPILLIIVLRLLFTFLSFIPIYEVLSLITLLNFFTPFILTIYAGFETAEKLKAGLIDAGTGGLICITLSFLINPVILFVLLYAGVLDFIQNLIANAFYPSAYVVSSYLVPSINFIGLLIELTIWGIVGFILGFIGGLIAQKLTKSDFSKSVLSGWRGTAPKGAVSRPFEKYPPSRVHKV